VLELIIVLASLFSPAATIGLSRIAGKERPEKREKRRRKVQRKAAFMGE
jgi:hypothetical protein